MKQVGGVGGGGGGSWVGSTAYGAMKFLVAVVRWMKRFWH